MMRRVCRLKTAALWASALCMASCTGMSAGRKTPTLAPRGDAVPVLAERQGAAFLLSRQNEDGSWGTFATRREREVLVTGPASFKAFSVATSALCVKALWQPALHAGKSDPAVEKSVRRGIAYLLAVQVADRAHPEVFCEVWSHTYRLEVMADVLGDERFKDLWPAARRVMQADADSLCRLQSAEGGFAYYDFKNTLRTPTGHYSTSFNTACTIRALLRAQAAGAAVPPGVMEQARRALLAMRTPEGTFMYGYGFLYHPNSGVNRPQGATGRTNLGLLALADMEGYRPQGDGEPLFKIKTSGESAKTAALLQEDLRVNLRRFRDNYNFLLAAYARPVPHEAYYANAGYFVTFGFCYAAEAAERLGGDDGRGFAAWESAEIAALQSDLGAWMDFPLYGYGQYYSTAYALLALQANARTLAKPNP